MVPSRGSDIAGDIPFNNWSLIISQSLYKVYPLEPLFLKSIPIKPSYHHHTTITSPWPYHEFTSKAVAISDFRISTPKPTSTPGRRPTCGALAPGPTKYGGFFARSRTEIMCFLPRWLGEMLASWGHFLGYLVGFQWFPYMKHVGLVMMGEL